MLRVASALVVLKTRGLMHPNATLFEHLKEGERKFRKHGSDKEVYDLTIEFVLDNYNLSFI